MNMHYELQGLRQSHVFFHYSDPTEDDTDDEDTETGTTPEESPEPGGPLDDPEKGDKDDTKGGEETDVGE